MHGKVFVLNNGSEMPALGLGTWRSEPGEVQKAVEHAINVGYRHIDTASHYGNEREVGQAIRSALASGKVRRKDLFITTKLWCAHDNRVEEDLSKSLEALGLEYVDMCLMHWPAASSTEGTGKDLKSSKEGGHVTSERSHIDVYRDMEKLLKKRKTRAIGVANYGLRYLEDLLPHVSVRPAVNQIENHPLLGQEAIVDFCNWNGILVTACSPLGSTDGPLIDIPLVRKLSEKNRTSPAVILLSWHTSSRRAVLARSITPDRIEENVKLVDLDKADVVEMDHAARELERQNGSTRYADLSLRGNPRIPSQASHPEYPALGKVLPVN